MYPDLLTYAPTVAAEFHLSLPEDLITSLRLLLGVDTYEGLSEWVYQTAASMSSDYSQELALLGYPIKWCFRRQDSLVWRLPPDHVAHANWEAFRIHLESTPADEFQRVALYNLAQDARGEYPLDSPEVAELQRLLTRARQLEWEKWGRSLVASLDEERLVTLLLQPEQLKARIISLLTRFWDVYYRDDFEMHRGAMAQSVAFHQQQTYPRNFTDVFRQVTGRAVTPTTRDYVQEHLEMIERVVFCPCAHLGLYFQITLSYPILVVAFNYRTTSAPTAAGKAAVELFPPLKALADESRLHILSLLQGREMYAQEIVEAIGLSQSTVSRHLQLLERTELVGTRQERGMKFYSIDRKRGREILGALTQLVG
jgi:DNA-binding transcriptional ArsR family regulator